MLAWNCCCRECVDGIGEGWEVRGSWRFCGGGLTRVWVALSTVFLDSLLRRVSAPYYGATRKGRFSLLRR
eukprot:4654496-Prorocentrum_lima.AAC.1